MRHCVRFVLRVPGFAGPGQGRGHREVEGRWVDRREVVAVAAARAPAGGEDHGPLQVLKGVPRPTHRRVQGGT